MRRSSLWAGRLVFIPALLAMICVSNRGTATGASTSVELSSPTNNAVATGTITISCAVSSNIQWINLDVDNSFYASGNSYVPSYTTTWNSARVANGGHSIQCNGYGSNGSLLGSDNANIMVSNGGATATPRPTSTPSNTPGPTPAPTPIGCTAIPGTTTPLGAACFPSSSYPVLNNAQDPLDFGADPSGFKDSSAAIYRALAAGDVHFSMPGIYLVALNSGHGIIPSAGRTIECAPGVTLTEKAENPTSGNYGAILSLQNGGNTVVGCDFKGGNSKAGPLAIGSNQGQLLIDISSNNVTVEGNTFEDTWGNSAVQVNNAYTGIAPANFKIQYNTFSHNPYYGPEVDQSTSGIIQNNLVIDGAMGPEDDSCNGSNGVGTVIIRNNELKVDVGNCALRGTPGCNAEAFITGGDYPPGCNYSGVSVTHNYCAGNTTQGALIHNVSPSGGAPANYSGNILGPNCSCQHGSNC